MTKAKSKKKKKGEIDLKTILAEEKFNFVSDENKIFIFLFTDEMRKIGFKIIHKVWERYDWGDFKLTYTKSDMARARIYLRKKGTKIWESHIKEFHMENSIVLKLYFDGIQANIDYIKNASELIKTPFVNDQGYCRHCEKTCKARKNYTLEGKHYEKCGLVFSYIDPKKDDIKDFIDILKQFYVGKKRYQIRIKFINEDIISLLKAKQTIIPIEQPSNESTASNEKPSNESSVSNVITANKSFINKIKNFIYKTFKIKNTL